MANRTRRKTAIEEGVRTFAAVLKPGHRRRGRVAAGRRPLIPARRTHPRPPAPHPHSRVNGPVVKLKPRNFPLAWHGDRTLRFIENLEPGGNQRHQARPFRVPHALKLRTSRQLIGEVPC